MGFSLVIPSSYTAEVSPGSPMKTVSALLCYLLVTAACGSKSDDVQPGDSDAAVTPPADFYQVKWGPKTIAPGIEDVECIIMRLGNDVPAKINRIHNVLGNVSHHLIVYEATETEEQLTPFACDSIENLVNDENGLPLVITQKAEETLQLPPGVAFAFKENTFIRLELHYVNASDNPMEVEVTSTFTPIAEAEFEHAAGLVFIGNPDISIAANSPSTLGPTFFELPPELYGVTFFGITGHEHQWGTNVYVETAADSTAPGTPVYELSNFNWNEPETVYHDPGFTIPDVGGFRFTCDWFNASGRRVGFGEGVDDEMCFFWAYYYPNRGSYTCFHTEQIAGTLDVCCPGNQLCNVIDDFFGSGAN